MAFPTSVNDQITDSVTEVLGNTPAIAMGNLFQAIALALSTAVAETKNFQ